MYNVPDGWLDYCAFGHPIRNTRIIATKTPLKSKFNSGVSRQECPPYVRGVPYKGRIPVEEEFTPTQLVGRLNKQFGKQLCAVVDLTFTSRYYDSKELIDLGVKYAKVKCPGHEIPNDGVYTRFKTDLSSFLKECGEESLVAVHCTHGLNRTGYLVCRYLMEESGFDAESAIRDFGRARGHDIERENYIQHLKAGCPHIPKASLHPSPSPVFSSQNHFQQHKTHHTARFGGCCLQRSPLLPGRSDSYFYEPHPMTHHGSQHLTPYSRPPKPRTYYDRCHTREYSTYCNSDPVAPTHYHEQHSACQSYSRRQYNWEEDY